MKRYTWVILYVYILSKKLQELKINIKTVIPLCRSLIKYVVYKIYLWKRSKEKVVIDEALKKIRTYQKGKKKLILFYETQLNPKKKKTKTRIQTFIQIIDSHNKKLSFFLV